jgi:aldose 1-epimerase
MEIVKPAGIRAAAGWQVDDAGGRILQLVLENNGITIELTNIGCAITAIRTPDRNGVYKNIVAGFRDLKDYRTNPDYFGCVVGRYANRIAGGKLQLDGKDYQLTLNDTPNHLHGGRQGFSHKIWELEELTENATTCGAMFSYVSPDGEEGYPGNLQVKVKYVLSMDHRLEISYSAVTDKATPVNLTNHSYFNLTGFEQPSILHHRLWLNAGMYTEKSPANTSTGKMLDVSGTALDFRTPRRIGECIDDFPADMGYDHNFVLDHAQAAIEQACAVLSEETTGRSVKVYTTAPAVQVYTGNYWNGTITGEQGHVYKKHGGVALETQAFPGSVSHPGFPNTILYPGEEYTSTTIFEFSVDQ